MPSSPAPDTRRAIIDIGSNSVRLVIYEGPARTPFEVHNEKIQARLGRGLSETGAIDAEAYERALKACERFKALVDASGVAMVRTVATAAAREASNGARFLADVAALGLSPELLSGEAEAAASAAGVLCAFPGARGLVGDLGGGSLELVALGEEGAGQRGSLPLGILRLAPLRAKGDKAFAARVSAMLRAEGWRKARGRPIFYLIGGSWRALGHLDMHLTGSQVPGVHGYSLARSRLKPLRKAIAEMGPRGLKAVPGLTSSRIASLDDAAALAEAVTAHLGAGELVVSGFGLREGLLFEALSPVAQAQDPLIAAVTDYAARRGNPRWQGEAVDGWLAPVFEGEPAAWLRLRRAACHLAGADLHTVSEARARYGMELAWLGGWIGLSWTERAMLAQAMWTAWGGKGASEAVAPHLEENGRRAAVAWGEAIRLAERLSGGVSGVLAGTRLERRAGAIVLQLGRAQSCLAGEVVAKQLGQLALALGLTPRIASA